MATATAVYGDNEFSRFISELEEINQISLSDEARQLLVLPLIEYKRIADNSGDMQLKNEYDKWRRSIREIFKNIKDKPAYFDRSNMSENDRTSLSVIKAYADKFCNIPPLCGER